MADVDFPKILPPFTIQYSTQEDPSIQRSTMETGRVRQTRRFTATRRVLSLSWVFTERELTFFRGWWFHKINMGASPFNLIVPEGDGGLQYQEVTLLGGAFTTNTISPTLRAVQASVEIYGGNNELSEESVDLLLERGADFADEAQIVNNLFPKDWEYNNQHEDN